GGGVVPRRVIAVATAMRARTDGLAGLGLPTEELPGGTGRRLVAGMAGTTEVPGVWVAGNATDLTAQVGASAAAGALAGAHINAVLAAADADAAVAAAGCLRRTGPTPAAGVPRPGRRRTPGRSTATGRPRRRPRAARCRRGGGAGWPAARSPAPRRSPTAPRLPAPRSTAPRRGRAARPGTGPRGRAAGARRRRSHGRAHRCERRGAAARSGCAGLRARRRRPGRAPRSP